MADHIKRDVHHHEVLLCDLLHLKNLSRRRYIREL